MLCYVFLKFLFSVHSFKLKSKTFKIKSYMFRISSTMAVENAHQNECGFL